MPEFSSQTAVATLELVVDEQPTADPATDLYHGKRREPLHPPVDGDVVDLVPVLLGGGTSFFDQLKAAPVELEGPTSVVQGTDVTHLRYRVRSR